MSEIRFSIIIRCTRGLASISKLLGALDSLEYPTDRFEVIVADSSTISLDISESPETRFDLRQLSLPGLSRSAVLNAAVRESKGEFLAFLDEGCVPAPDWLQAYETAFDAWLAGVVGGSFQPPKDGDAYQKCVGLVHSSLAQSIGLVTGQQVVGRYFPRSGNMAARRESVLLAGGFDEDARECPEIRMISRMQRIGYRAFYSPGAVVYCHQDPGLLKFMGKDFRTATERARFCRRRSGAALFRVGAAALILFMIGLSCDPAIVAGQAMKLVAGGYLLTLVLSSLHAAISAGSLAVAIFLPLFLVIHHLVYAVGFAYGRLMKV